MNLPERPRRILTLALPIIGGMVSQNILNLIDTAMVAHLRDNALAAVGVGSFASFMASAFITGLGVGVQTMSARRLGEERTDEMAIPLNGGLILAIGMAIPLSAILFWLTPDLFPVLIEDPDVVEIGVPYLQVRLLGMAALGANFAFRGYWNGVNLSRIYMRTLILMHICNVVFNYVLIFGKLGFPEYGATGAAMGTTASLYLGAIYYVYLAFKHAREAGFAREIPRLEKLLTMLWLSVPAALQNFFFAAGMTTFFWIIGRIGTAQLAASQVLVNLVLVAILPGIGFGLAANSLVSQALGREDPTDAKAWGWEVARLAALIVGLIAVPVLIFPDFFLSPFLYDPETLALARTPLRLIAAFISFEVVGLVLLNALFGAGDTRRVMVVSIGMQWLVGLPLAYVVSSVLGYGLLAVWIVHLGYRGGQSVIFSLMWHGEKWTDIEV